MARKKHKTSDYFRKMHGINIGGATLVKGSELIPHATNVTALTGDITGFAHLGVASGMGNVAMDIALRPMQEAERRQRRKKKKRR